MLVALLVVAVTGTLGVTLGYVQAAAVDGARASLTAAPPTARGVLLTTRLASGEADGQAQDARVREVAADLLAGTEHDVVRQVRTEPLATTREDGTDLGRWALAALPEPGGTEGLETVEGTWPAGDEQVAVQAEAAEATGLAVGDVLQVGDPGTTVTVSGTWRVADPDDPRWFADQLLLEGADGTGRGPLVASPALIAAQDTDPLVRWTVVPGAAVVRPGDLPALATLADDLDSRLGEDDGVAPRGLRVEGSLAETAAETAETLRAADAVALVPLGLLAVVSLVALVQVARLLAATREAEVALLVARGAAPATVTAGAAAEAALLAAASSAAGLLAAGLALRLLVPDAEQGGTVATVAVVVAVAATAVLALVAGLQARAAARRQVTDRSGRARTVAALSTVILTVVAAAVCLWQLRRYGSPLVITADGARTDPLSALAPALVLAGLAVAVMAVLGPVTRLWSALAARARGAVGVLAARQVARRLVVYVVPVVLLVLAGGSATLAAGYAGTSERLQDDVATVRNGTDVRVALPKGIAVDPALVSALAGLDGVTAAAPVGRHRASAGSMPVTLLTVPASAVEGVVRAPAQVADVPSLAEALVAPESAGPVLPDGAREVTLSVTASAQLWDPFTDAPAPVPADDWYLDRLEQVSVTRVDLVLTAPDGSVVQLVAGELSHDLDGDGTGASPQAVGATPERRELTATLPETAGDLPWQLLAIDVDLGVDWNPARTTLAVHALDVDGAPVDLGDGWVHAPDVTGPGYELADSGTPAVDLVAFEDLTVRYLPDGALVAPVVLSAGLAEDLGVARGDSFEAVVAGGAAQVEVADVVAVVPGALERHVLVADPVALARSLLATPTRPPTDQEVWLAASSPGATVLPDDAARVAGEARALVVAAAEAGGTPAEAPEVTTPGYDAGAVDASAPIRVSFWLAAVGAVILALSGVLAVSVALLRSRRGEVVVLRAVGLGPVAQGRTRATELLAVGAAALLLGVVAGGAVGLITVPGLTVATLTGLDTAPPARFGVDGLGVVLCVGVALAGLVAVALVVAGRVAAQARDTEYREEVR